MLRHSQRITFSAPVEGSGVTLAAAVAFGVGLCLTALPSTRVPAPGNTFCFEAGPSALDAGAGGGKTLVEVEAAAVVMVTGQDEGG